MKLLEDSKAIRLKIMDFLSRREHSTKEIFTKMSSRVESKGLLEVEIENLKQEGLISDERFAESYFHSRKNKGYGPLRIRNELKQRGVGDKLYYPLANEIEWSEFALEVLKKKVRGNMPTETKEILKLKKFLNYRGFNFQDIDRAFRLIKSELDH